MSEDIRHQRTRNNLNGARDAESRKQFQRAVLNELLGVLRLDVGEIFDLRPHGDLHYLADGNTKHPALVYRSNITSWEKRGWIKRIEKDKKGNSTFEVME